MSLHARGDVYLYAHEALSFTWIQDIFGAGGGEISDGGEKGKLPFLPLCFCFASSAFSAYEVQKYLYTDVTFVAMKEAREG